MPLFLFGDGVKQKTNRAARRPATYRDALSSLRATAQEGVQEGIQVACSTFHETRPARRPYRHRKARGMELEALYGGILNAVALSIMETASPGCEVSMARLVADQLIAKVEEMGCVGRAYALAPRLPISYTGLAVPQPLHPIRSFFPLRAPRRRLE